jgi:hypothetical protein
MAGMDDIDIFDNPFRDPVYEELGFIFDPDRNQYFEVIQDPEYGAMRRYYSPRDREPVPELSDARIAFDEQLQREDMARYLAQIGELDRLMSGRIAGRVSDADISRFRRFKKRKPLYKSGERVFGLPVEKFEVMQAVGKRSDESERKRINQLIRDMGFDPNASGGVGSLEMDLFRRSQ